MYNFIDMWSDVKTLFVQLINISNNSRAYKYCIKTLPPRSLHI